MSRSEFVTQVKINLGELPLFVKVTYGQEQVQVLCVNHFKSCLWQKVGGRGWRLSEATLEAIAASGYEVLNPEQFYFRGEPVLKLEASGISRCFEWCLRIGKKLN